MTITISRWLKLAFVFQIRCSKKLGVDLFWVTLVLDVSLDIQRVLIPHFSFYGKDCSEVRWKIQPDRIRTMDRTMTMASRVIPAKGQNIRSGKIPLGKWERTEVMLSSLLSWTRTLPRALFIYVFMCVCVCILTLSCMCTGYCDLIDPCPYFISFPYLLSAFLLLTSPPTFLSILKSLSLIKIIL